MTTDRERMEPLLALIRRYEGRHDYNIVSDFVVPVLRPTKPLTLMTIGEVLGMQQEWRSAATKSSAVGAYQIIYKTLNGLYREAGFAKTTKFGPTTQDVLAVALLNRRGLQEWLSDDISDPAFMLGLAQEWAAFPVPYDVNGKRTGQSYYDGDGLNKSHVSIDQVKLALNECRNRRVSPVGSVGVIQMIINLLLGLFRKRS